MTLNTSYYSTRNPDSLHKMKNILIISALFILFVGCGKQDEPVPGNVQLCADITVVTPLSGLGDNGYNDEALAGVLKAVSNSSIDVSLLRPKTLEQVGEYVRQWSTHETSNRRLLILADAEYSGLLSDVNTSPSKSVLLFENDGKSISSDIATFRISRYGTAYLSGCLAMGSEKVHIIHGKKGDPTSEEAAKGFADGYLKSRHDGKIIYHSLSDTYSGWSMPDSLYRLAAENQNDFFFPLAKGSNAGVYKFSRESPFVLMLITGMDVDCSTYSKRVPFSMLVDVKKVVKDYVSRWISGENISGHRDFGMKDEVTSVKFSTLFYEINDIWEGYYNEPEYWQNIYETNYDEAVRKEADYEAAR